MNLSSPSLAVVLWGSQLLLKIWPIMLHLWSWTTKLLLSGRLFFMAMVNGWQIELLNSNFLLKQWMRNWKKTNLSTQEQAFQTILKNRINRGGILAPGAGKVKNGENGKGLASRWYPETLSKRIRKIIGIRDRFTFVEGDGLEFIRQNQQRPDAVYFIDPPYTAGGKRAGSRLYTHFELDHEELFNISSSLAGDFLMTYSNDRDVQRLAQKYQLAMKKVAMKNTHHAKMTELLIGRNLDWYG
jgi:DNA adenine methylase